MSGRAAARRTWTPRVSVSGPIALSVVVFGREGLPKSRPWLRRDVVDVDVLAAVLAGQPRVSDLSAPVMAQDDWRPFGAGQVCVPPAHERDDRGKEVPPGRRQSVLVAVGIAGV